MQVHVKVQTDHLRDALNKVLSVVDKRNSRPILTYTLITAEEGFIHLSATDLEVSARVSVEADILEKGSFCLNAKNLFDILRELPTGTVDLSLNSDENTLKLHCQDIHYSLLIYNGSDFPPISFGNDQNKFSLTSSSVLEIINKTSHAISSDETRLNLNGIYMHTFDGKLRAVATDGHRLSMYDVEVDDVDIEALINGIIIPRKGVNELKKIAESHPDSKITLSVDDSFLYASAENKYFLSVRLISREYPKYQKIIPAKSQSFMSADRITLFNAIKRIKIMSNEKSNGVRVKLANNEMLISANHPSLGDAYERVPIKYEGKDLEIGFNAKYLIDTLSIFEEGDISFELDNEHRPVVIKSQILPHYLGIVMPLKL